MVVNCLPRTNTDAWTDEELIQLASAGDRGAWDVLLKRHESTFFRLAMSVVKSEAHARDVVQMAFINIYSKIDTFDGRGAFSSWANRVVYNAALMHLRKKKRLREVSMEAVAPASSDNSEVDPTFHGAERPDRAYSNRQLGAHIVAAIDALEPKYRRIVELREYRGFTMEELADELGLSVGGAKTRLHRARSFLRVSLQRHYPEMSA